MGRYYNFEKDDSYNTREEKSIFGGFNHDNPAHVQRALKRTSLHQAVCNSDYDEAESLLSLGRVKIDQQDSHGNTALHLAMVNQDSFPIIYQEIIELLKKHKAKDSVKNHYGQTTLDLANESSTNRKKFAHMFDLPPHRDAHH